MDNQPRNSAAFPAQITTPDEALAATQHLAERFAVVFPDDLCLHTAMLDMASDIKAEIDRQDEARADRQRESEFNRRLANAGQMYNAAAIGCASF